MWLNLVAYGFDGLVEQPFLPVPSVVFYALTAPAIGEFQTHPLLIQQSHPSYPMDD